MNRIFTLVFVLSFVHVLPVMPFLLWNDPWPSLEDAAEPKKYQAKTFSEAVVMLKQAEPGSHIEFPSYRIDKASHVITGTKTLVLTKEHGIQDIADTKKEELLKTAAKLVLTADAKQESVKPLSSAVERKKKHRQKIRYKKKNY